MFLGISDSVRPVLLKLKAFISEIVIPNESKYLDEVEQGDRWQVPAIMEQMKRRAKAEGLFNLFLSDENTGLSNVEYAHLAEAMGQTEMAAEVFNCAAPDTGNMEVLSKYGTIGQKDSWLKPLLEGTIRSGFAMTEPAVASSDATNISSVANLQGDDWIIDGEKWWISGAGDPRCKLLIVMCVTNPQAQADKRQSLIIVPMDTPGIEISRMIKVFGYDDAPHGHAQIRFKHVRVPRNNLIGEAGQGFEITQERLGSGRIHHCMRSIGAAERALSLMIERSNSRVAFGKPLSQLGGNVDLIANSRIEIEMCRLLTLKAAFQLDEKGLDLAVSEIAQMKVAVPNMALNVIDRAIQMHGGAGVSQDTPLAKMWASHRTLRLADGPDEVHREAIARCESGHHPQMYV